MVNSVVGKYYEAGSSQNMDATLILHPLEEIEVRYGGKSDTYHKNEYMVEPELGSLDRVVHFKRSEGDCRFETSDRAGFAQLESQLSTGKAWRLVAWLEGHWKGTLACVGGLVLFTFVFFQWILPGIAWKVAVDMPQSWRRTMTIQSIDTMEDMGFLDESGLSIEEHERVQEIFYEAIDLAGVTDSEYEYELSVYESSRIGANAFAFPSGLIVATDEFVELCETDDQILAVFLHEITHVEQQHGIRALVQQGGVFVVSSILLGDVSGAISLAEGLPALLMNSQYSQRFELECDTFAAEVLERSGIGAVAMKDILILLHKDAPDVPIAAYLSSHPSLQKRVENIERIENSPEE